MAERDWRGSFAIPMTPFDEQDRIDEDALRAEVQFCFESGVGGLCVPVMVSEFRVLSEAERVHHDACADRGRTRHWCARGSQLRGSQHAAGVSATRGTPRRWAPTR